MLNLSNECDLLIANLTQMSGLTQSLFVAVVPSLVAWRWVGPQALWRLWRGALVDELVPGACICLGLQGLGLGFSLALAVCGSWALFFVSSWCVALVGMFLHGGALCWLDGLRSVMAEDFLYFNNSRISGEDLVPVECICPPPAPRWLRLMFVLRRWFCCC